MNPLKLKTNRSSFCLGRTGFMFMLVSFSLVFSQCKEDDDAVSVTSPFKSYIQVGNKFYSLKEANAFYGVKNNETIFNIALLDGEADNVVIMEDLIIQNTVLLTEGKFNYKKAVQQSDVEVNHFHLTSLKYGPENDKFLINSAQSVLNTASLDVIKTDNNYVLDVSFEFVGQKVKVHYEGEINHIEAW